MSIEVITVLYFIANEGETCWLDEISQNLAVIKEKSNRDHLHHSIPNAYELTHEFAGKEIYLYDILQSIPIFQNTSENGLSYRYVAYTSPSLIKAIPLNSPTSVIPVFEIDRKPMMILHLFPSLILPVVPPSQVNTYTSMNRYQIYSISNAKSAQNQVNNRQNSGLKSVAATATVSPKSQSTSLNSSNTKSRNTPDQPLDSSPHSLTRHSTQQQSSSSSTNTTTSTSGNKPTNTEKEILNSDEVVAAMAETAKEAARSLFSFASSAMKNVADVTTSAANLSLSSLVAQGTTTVGKTKITVIRELADGGFGKVYLVQDANNTNRQYAMKQMHCQSGEQEKDAIQELQALQKFSDHENIIHVIDSGTIISKNLKTVLILFPLCSQGTAWDAIARANPNEIDGSPWPFPEKKALHIILCIGGALAYIHDFGFTHRDVKPHNILLADDGIPLLTDFGSIAPAVVEIPNRQRALITEEEAASKTSAPYRSPELTQVPYPCVLDDRVDVWGLGCSLYCLAFGWSPFESKREGVLRLAIINGRFNFPNPPRMRDCMYSSTFKELVEAMLIHDMNNRPHSHEVVNMLESALSRS